MLLSIYLFSPVPFYTEGEFYPDRPYENLAIPVKKLVRYWWNNLADQEAIIEDAFEDILTIYKARLLPEKDEEETVDFSVALEKIFWKWTSQSGFGIIYLVKNIL